MNNLCADIGYRSINHFGEKLCGDHIDIVEQNDDSKVIVLADGMGSGVKASILSTLTSKIISTMMAEGLPIEECVKTIAATLPVCSVREVAYSTFTIIRIINSESVEIIQYDNPKVLFPAHRAVYKIPGRTAHRHGPVAVAELPVVVHLEPDPHRMILYGESIDNRISRLDPLPKEAVKTILINTLPV